MCFCLCVCVCAVYHHDARRLHQLTKSKAATAQLERTAQVRCMCSTAVQRTRASTDTPPRPQEVSNVKMALATRLEEVMAENRVSGLAVRAVYGRVQH